MSYFFLAPFSLSLCGVRVLQSAKCRKELAASLQTTLTLHSAEM